MKKIGIIVAMPKEWDALFAQYGLSDYGFHKGTTEGGVPYVAKISGIG